MFPVAFPAAFSTFPLTTPTLALAPSTDALDLVDLGLVLAERSAVLSAFAFALSVFLSSFQAFMVAAIPGADDLVGFLTLLRAAPAVMLFGSLYVLFYVLTPKRYRFGACPKWPGAAFVTGWWVLTSALLPTVLASLGGYDLTYGSLAGVTIALPVLTSQAPSLNLFIR